MKPAGRPTTAMDAVCNVVFSLRRTTAARVAEELDWDHARAAHALNRAAKDERINRRKEKGNGRLWFYVYEVAQ